MVKSGGVNLIGRTAQTTLRQPAAGAASVRKIIHKGHRLVFKLRRLDGECSTKTYAVVPIPPKDAEKGKAAGAESFLEVAKSVKAKLQKGKHVAAADASRALQKAAQLAEAPSLAGVSHLRFIFTPLSTVPKRGLPQT